MSHVSIRTFPTRDGGIARCRRSGARRTVAARLADVSIRAIHLL
jgi:hypothetical protein